jgi:predicted small lipoprotein YifL
MQGFLQIHNDLTAVGEGELNHASDALVVDIDIAALIQSVAALLQHMEQRFGTVQKLKVGHYNFTMLKIKKIQAMACISLASALYLTGCGQTGPLYLPAKAALHGGESATHALIAAPLSSRIS